LIDPASPAAIAAAAASVEVRVLFSKYERRRRSQIDTEYIKIEKAKAIRSAQGPPRLAITLFDRFIVPAPRAFGRSRGREQCA